jgi:hypothetical protein
MLLNQWQCMRYVQPPTRIAFSSKQPEATALIGQGYRPPDIYAATGFPPPPAFFPEVEAVFQRFESASSLLEQRNAAATAVWGTGAGGGLFASNTPDFNCAVFLHGRTSRSGHERLVVCENPTSAEVTPSIGLCASVIEPASLTGLRKWDTANSSVSPFPLLAQGDTRWLRLYVGQADPSDRARFTIHYATAAGEGNIEGTLTDADTVEFRIVDGPLVVGSAGPTSTPADEK